MTTLPASKARVCPSCGVLRRSMKHDRCSYCREKDRGTDQERRRRRSCQITPPDIAERIARLQQRAEKKLPLFD